MFHKSRERTQARATEYATCHDFKQIFTEDMAGLHQLAYLLTADQAKAEACFVAGLEESIHGGLVFKQWARAWSKRTIIRNAIKTVAPWPRSSSPEADAEGVSGNAISGQALLDAISGWPAFERFVFVMAVLEGYSPRECSALLACPLQDVVAAKSRALRRLGAVTSTPASAAALKSLPWPAVFAPMPAA